MDRISSCGRFAQQIVHEGAYDQQPKRIRYQGQSKYDVQPDADVIEKPKIVRMHKISMCFLANIGTVPSIVGRYWVI
jgi:hypothetical protein